MAGDEELKITSIGLHGVHNQEAVDRQIQWGIKWTLLQLRRNSINLRRNSINLSRVSWKQRMKTGKTRCQFGSEENYRARRGEKKGRLHTKMQPTCSSAMDLPRDWISKDTWFIEKSARNKIVSFITSRSRVLLRAEKSISMTIKTYFWFVCTRFCNWNHLSNSTSDSWRFWKERRYSLI